ncbi:ABC transporter ATP-binding protein [Streptomyces sp. NPDC048424]|uniref:ABC transporter ATP-binding protein n=1 Tax=Streptomyces sp. NPDC048424 TaxID=3155265 RepID=UPI0034175DE5
MQVTGLHHAYRRHAVLRGIDLSLPPGILAGIVGENGAGKSTLLKILSGEMRPTSGTVTHGGRFGYCPQDVVLNDALTVRQHLAFFKTAYGLTDLRRAEEIMAALRFTEYADVRSGVLSGGTRQKLNLTLALMHDPQVLLLDEPYQGFDWDTYQRFWELAARLRDSGRSVLVVSHLAYDAERLDRLYRLEEGRLQSHTPVPSPAPAPEGTTV